MDGTVLDRSGREATIAWWLVPATLLAMVLSGVWSLVVGTASFGGEESELVRGWGGVLRNLPGYLLFGAVPALGVLFAARSLRHGSRRGRAALVGTSIALLFALGSLTRDSAEVVMTTRAATVSWILFAVDAVIVAALFVTARRAARRGGAGRVS